MYRIKTFSPYHRAFSIIVTLRVLCLVVIVMQLLASTICHSGLSIFEEGLTRGDPSVCGAPEQMRCRSPSGYLQWNAAPDGGRGKHIPPARAPLLSSSSRPSPSSSPCIAVLFKHTHTHTRTTAYAHTLQKAPVRLPLWNVCSLQLFESRCFRIKDLPRRLLGVRWLCRIKDHSAVYSEALY